MFSRWLQHFLDRFGLGAEWMGGLIITLFGMRLLTTPGALEFPAYDLLTATASQTVWGTLCLVGGLSRLVILIANGRFRFGAHARAFIALLVTFFWFQVAWGFVLYSTATGLPIYVGLFIAEVVGMVLAAREAAHVDNGAVENGK